MWMSYMPKFSTLKIITKHVFSSSEKELQLADFELRVLLELGFS